MRSKIWDRDSVHNISGLRITHGYQSPYHTRQIPTFFVSKTNIS